MQGMKIVLHGRPITKKNHQQIRKNRATGARFIAQADAYTDYEAACIWQITAKVRRRIDFPVNVRCVYYMPTLHKVDLGNLLAASCDILVKASVIEDDNSRIVAGHDGSRVRYDKERPRVEIFIEAMEVNDV